MLTCMHASAPCLRYTLGLLCETGVADTRGAPDRDPLMSFLAGNCLEGTLAVEKPLQAVFVQELGAIAARVRRPGARAAHQQHARPHHWGRQSQQGCLSGWLSVC